jgi:hypothetical protein
MSGTEPLMSAIISPTPASGPPTCGIAWPTTATATPRRVTVTGPPTSGTGPPTIPTSAVGWHDLATGAAFGATSTADHARPSDGWRAGSGGTGHDGPTDSHLVLLSSAAMPPTASSPRPRGIGRQQPKTRTRRLGRRATTMLAVTCPACRSGWRWRSVAATAPPAARDPIAAQRRLLAAAACLTARPGRGSRLAVRPAPTPTQQLVSPP